MLDFWSDESSSDSSEAEEEGGALEPLSQSEAEANLASQRLHRVREAHVYQRRLRELQGLIHLLHAYYRIYDAYKKIYTQGR